MQTLLRPILNEIVLPSPVTTSKSLLSVDRKSFRDNVRARVEVTPRTGIILDCL